MMVAFELATDTRRGKVKQNKPHNIQLENISLAGCWWLTPVILATQEAEIRMFAVQSQRRQIVHEILS
jgi:hypothetical protein